MEPYAQHNTHLSPQVIQAAVQDYWQARQFFQKLPQNPPHVEEAQTSSFNPTLAETMESKRLWSCHGLCRGTQPFLKGDWKIVDGFFNHINTFHSWLVHKASNLILDVYPVGLISGPILLDGIYSLPYIDTYLDTSQERIRQRLEEKRRIYMPDFLQARLEKMPIQHPYSQKDIQAFEHEGQLAIKAYQSQQKIAA